MLPSNSQQSLKEHSKTLRQALLAEILTLGWMIVEAGAALVLGTSANSLLLEGFGLDSLIELLSALVLLWRIGHTLLGKLSPMNAERLERRASQLSGYLLGLLALSLAYMAIHRLLGPTPPINPSISIWGVLIGFAALGLMPLLATWKLQLAERLQSRALRADAVESATCGYLSIVLVVGLIAERLLGWRQLDSFATLAFIPFLLHEAHAAILGKPCCKARGTHEEKL